MPSALGYGKGSQPARFGALETEEPHDGGGKNGGGYQRHCPSIIRGTAHCPNIETLERAASPAAQGVEGIFTVWFIPQRGPSRPLAHPQ